MDYKRVPLECFEYGSGEFPSWFNSLVGNTIEIFDGTIFTQKNSLKKIAAGKILNKSFYYGDIIVKGEKNIFSMSKYDYLKENIL